MPRFKRILVFCGLLLFPPGALATPTAEERIAHLKQNPRQISEAIQDLSQPEVAEFFIRAAQDPARIRQILPNADEPVPFRSYLLGHLAGRISAAHFPPTPVSPGAYVLAWLSAFRDQSPHPGFRERAYYLFVNRIYPSLSEDLRTNVLNALRQYNRQPAHQAVTVPALFLVESLRVSRERLAVLDSASLEAQRRGLEALGRVPDKTADPQIQAGIARFLNSQDTHVRRSARGALIPPSKSVLAQRHRIYADTLELLVSFLKTPYPGATRIAAAEVLGLNFATTFFQPVPTPENQKILSALASLLASGTPAERQAASQSLLQMKPAEEPVQLALVEAAFRDPDRLVSLNAFEALGARHQHRGERRVRSEAVKRAVVESLSAILRSEIADPQGTLQEDGAEILSRNPPRDLGTYLQLAELASQWPQNQASERRTRLKLKGALQNHPNIELEQGDESGILLKLLAHPELPLAETLSSLVRSSKLDPYVIAQTLLEADDNARALLVNELAHASAQRWSALLATPRGDLSIAEGLIDPNPAVRSPLLSTLAKMDISLKGAPASLRQVLATLCDFDATEQQVEDAFAIMTRIENIRGRHLWMRPDDVDLIDELVRVAQIAPSLGRGQSAELAHRLLLKLQARQSTQGNECSRTLLDSYWQSKASKGPQDSD